MAEDCDQVHIGGQGSLRDIQGSAHKAPCPCRGELIASVLAQGISPTTQPDGRKEQHKAWDERPVGPSQTAKLPKERLSPAELAQDLVLSPRPPEAADPFPREPPSSIWLGSPLCARIRAEITVAPQGWGWVLLSWPPTPTVSCLSSGLEKGRCPLRELRPGNSTGVGGGRG